MLSLTLHPDVRPTDLAAAIILASEKAAQAADEAKVLLLESTMMAIVTGDVGQAFATYLRRSAWSSVFSHASGLIWADRDDATKALRRVLGVISDSTPPDLDAESLAEAIGSAENQERRAARKFLALVLTTGSANAAEVVQEVPL